MFKKTASLALAISIAVSAFAGSAAAATKLESSVESLLGIKYKYAGSTTKGFDCSGFTSYVFAKFGIELPRRSVDQATVGTKVAKDELRAGDLVFFNTNGKEISHVGIYLGDGTFAHASTSQGTTITELSDKYYAKRYVTARRILSESSFQQIAANDANTNVTATPAKVAAAAAESAAEFVLPPETAISDDAAVAAGAAEVSPEAEVIVNMSYEGL